MIETVLLLLDSALCGFPLWLSCKEFARGAGDLGLISGLGRCSGEGKDYPFQLSGLEKFMDFIVLRVTHISSLIEFEGLLNVFRKYRIELLILESLDSKNELYLTLKSFMILSFEIKDE